MNWYKIALEIEEQGKDAYYTDIGHDWYFDTGILTMKTTLKKVDITICGL